MRITMVGGGLVASNLVNLIKKSPARTDKITIVEQNRRTCEVLANTLDVDIIHGNGTNLNVLESAGCAETDVFLALTGRDEDNLIACQLAKKVFAVHSPIARVTNPRNIGVIQALGIYNTFSSSMLLAKVLNQEIEHSGLYVVYDIPGNSKAIVEFSLRPDAAEAGVTLKECKLPRDSRIVLVTHTDGVVELAQGDTIMHPHDRIMMVCDHDDFQEIRERLIEQRLPEALAEDLAEKKHAAHSSF